MIAVATTSATNHRELRSYGANLSSSAEDTLDVEVGAST